MTVSDKVKAAAHEAAEKLDAAAYKAAPKIEAAGESFGDRVEATNQSLTDRFGDATDRFAGKLAEVTHQGEHRTPPLPEGVEGPEEKRGFMDKVNDVLDTLADKLPGTGPDDERLHPRH